MQLTIRRPTLAIAVLAVIAVAVGFSVTTPTKAAGKIQYKAVAPDSASQESVQKLLDIAAGAGWEYVGSTPGTVMIFKK